MAVKLPDTLVPMADFPSAFAKDVQFTDGENLQDKLDKGKLGSSSGGTGLTEEQANNIEKIPSIEGIVTSNSQAIENKADKDHEHTEYLTEIPDEYVTDTKLSTELDKKVNKEEGKGLSTNDLTNELVVKINSSATEAFVTNAIANAQLGGGEEVDLSGYATVDALNLKADLTHTHDQYLTEVPDEYITETELTAKGYLTEHQDISGLQSKTDNSLTTTDKTVTGAINELNNKQQLTEITLTSIEDLSNIEVGEYDAIIASSCELIKSGIYHVIKTSDTDIVLTSVDGNILSFNNPPWFPTWRQDPDKCFPQVSKYTLTDLSVLDDFGRGYFDAYIESSLSDGLVDSGIYNVYNPGGSITFTSMSGVSYKYNKTDGAWTLETKGNFATETFVTSKIAEASLSGGDVDISGLQPKTDSNLTTTSKEVVGAINEVKDKADLILDTEVRIDKTYSSSKIYSDIQDAIDSNKSFTLAEIGKMSGASYKVVASTAEMTDEKIIYLLKNGATYDMYIVETTGTTTKIGDTTINLSTYLKIEDAESAYLKKTEATSTYVAQTSFNNHITDTVAHLTQFEKNKLLTTDNITSTINNSSDNTQVPSAKAINDKFEEAIDTINTSLESYSIPINTYMGLNHYLAIKIKVHDMNYSFNISDRSGNIYEGAFFSYNGSFSVQIKKINNSSIKNGYILGFRQYKLSHDEIYLVMKVSDYSHINGVINTSSVLKPNIEILVNDNSTLWDKGTDIVVKELVTTVAGVGVTTITSVNSNITGNIEYTVKNGICYVSMKDLMSTISSTNLLISTKMPKPSINCTAPSVNAGGNIATIYIDKNTAKLYGDFYTKNAKSNCSFSYPVAE